MKIERFPDEINHFLENTRVVKNKVGLSGDDLYEANGINCYYLKVSKDCDRLEREKIIFEWLNENNYLPVPEVLFWLRTKNKAYLITKKVRGKMAIDPFYLKRPKSLAKILSQAIEMVANVPLDKYPFKNELINNKEKNYVFSHGDLCLPNIMIRNNKICGFIDMGDCGINEKWYDVATCLRSYEFNLKSKKHSEYFLNSLNKPNIKRIMEFYPVVFG